MKVLNQNDFVSSEEVAEITGHTVACGIACASICMLAGGFAAGLAWVAQELD